MKKVNDLTSKIKEAVSIILHSYVELEPIPPSLPLKNLKWGNIWFDEFYDENKYGDITFVMSPEKLILLLDLSLTHSGNSVAYFTDGSESIEVLKGTLDVATLESVQSLDYPIFVLDNSSSWFFELNYEGSNFFANQELMKKVVNNLGGTEKIYSEMLDSLNEYKDIRDISECEYEYLTNVKLQLEELTK